MPRARRCADGEYPRCRVVVYRVIGYVLSDVNELEKRGCVWSERFARDTRN